MDHKEIFAQVVEKPFSIRSGANLSIEIEGITTKFTSTLIGYTENEYLVIKMPKYGNMSLIRAKLLKGNRIVVRFIEEGTIYGFEAEILGAMNDPVKLIIVSYPKIVSQYELRGKKRYECIIPGMLHQEGNQYAAVMTDVSEQGCSITIKVRDIRSMPALSIGDQVTFHFMIPGSENKLFLSGEVKNLNQGHARTILGIIFLNVTEDLKAVLDRYIIFMGDVT